MSEKLVFPALILALVFMSLGIALLKVRSVGGPAYMAETYIPIQQPAVKLRPSQATVRLTP